MILLADSGSTKCDWVSIDPDGNQGREYKTIGLNPYYHSEDVIRDTILGNKELVADLDKFDRVYFYGAGSSSPEMCDQVKRGLAAAFTKSEVYVDHDLLGAVYAVYTGEPCICCILGTGSNAVYFDGNDIHEAVPALGHALGDEASGSYYGKRLLTDYFYLKMPQDLAEQLKEEYQLTKESVMEQVYLKPHPNVYLASFSKFLSSRIEHPYVQEVVKEGMRKFLDYHVMCYDNYRDVPTHFIGSIAYYFNQQLAEVCSELGIEMGKTVKRPIDGIAEYHRVHTLARQL